MSNARNLARLLPNSSGQLPDAAMASGSVIQVASIQHSTQITVSTGGEAYVGISASITPTSATSKILVLFTVAVGFADNTNAASQVYVRRGTSTAAPLVALTRLGGYANNAWVESYQLPTLQALDSPNSASSVTYGVFVANLDGNPNANFNQSGGVTNLTLIEVAP